MPVCCCDGEAYASGPQTCAELGQDCRFYFDLNQCPKRLCSFLGLLTEFLGEESRNNEVILSASSGTFASLYELRDELLPRSQLGQQLIQYYDRYADRAASIIRADPNLLQEALRVFLVGAAFSQTILRVLHGTAREEVRARRYTQHAYESLISVIARFRDVAGDAATDFEEPLSFLEREIAPLVGRSSEEVLSMLLEGD